MDYGSIRSHLQQAESELLAFINPTEKTKDYDRMQECLDWAREISALLAKIPQDDNSQIHELPGHPESLAASKTDTPYDIRRCVEKPTTATSPTPVSEALPCYFAYQGKMFKIGQSRGDEGGLYKKSIPLKDALTISTAVEELLVSQHSLSVADVMRKLSNEFPIYKINLTLGVLTQMGTLIAQGRGQYSYAENAKGPAAHWIRTVEQYPQKLNLLNEITAQRKG